MTIHLPQTNRLLFHAELRPAMGVRFQPTGFPDIGAADFEGPDGKRRLIVESTQSMANRLEAVCFDSAARKLAPPLEGLPYVEVETKNGPTSTLEEAHRLNSVYVVKATDFFVEFAGRLGYKPKGTGFEGKQAPTKPVLAREVFRVDPNSLIHGVFLEKIAGVLRLQRLLSAFIEAEGVREAVYGGVKNDHLDATGKREDSGGAAGGYGNVPYHRTEYTAERIAAYFSIDVGLLRAYSLPSEATALAYVFCLWKIRKLVDGDLRLRTACDFVVDEIAADRPRDWQLPDADTLDEAIQGAISAARKEDLLGDVIRVKSKA